MSDASRVVKAGHAMYYGGLVAKLERELAEARREIASLRPRAEKSNDYRLAAINAEAEIEGLDQKLSKARKQRDTLAKTVRVYLDTERDGGILYSDALSELQEALAAVKGGQNG